MTTEFTTPIAGKAGHPAVEARNLVREFARPSGPFSKKDVLTAVNQVSFEIAEGEIVCLLGESGCGKTTIARMLMHLCKPTSGEVLLGGVPVHQLSEHAFRPFRRTIQMVYQNPFDCLDPSRKVRDLLAEPLKIWHPGLDRASRDERILQSLSECALGEECLGKHPTEFSGGQLQRLSIARMLLVEPKVIIADEIVSALDVPVQNQVLQLLLDKRDKHGFSVLFITHDLSVARKVADRVLVMRQGALVAAGPPVEVLDRSDDPYVRTLAQSAFTFE